MSFSIYDALVPPLTHMLGSFAGFLTKAENYAKEKGIDPKTYIEGRLIEDMLPLTKQVQIASDQAKGAAARLSGQEAPKYDDNEASFEELRARLRKTIAYMRSIDAKAFAGAEDRKIHLKFPNAEFNFVGTDYLNNWVLPNVYFHITTGYAILRMKGVPLGKPDYLSGDKA
jgi:hypothetical protein